MVEEIIYTSAPQGLKPGSRGFCTVASTPGMATTLATLLESLSGYRHLANSAGATGGINPVAFCHYHAVVGGRSIGILSRIADAGHDYSGRSNKLAHHVAYAHAQPNQAGPVATQQQPGFHETSWSGDPRLIHSTRSLPNIDSTPAICTYWEQVTGHAGWGGVFAERLLDDRASLSVIYPAEVDMLRLLGESLALLSPRKRWQVTYTTFYTKLPPGIDCRVRCAVDGTPEANQLRKRYDLKALDLCRPLGAPPAGMWADAGRTGQIPDAARLSAASVADGEGPPGLDDESYEIDLDDVVSSSPPPLPVGGSPGLRRRHSAEGGENSQDRKRLTWLTVAAIALAACLLVVGTLLILDWRSSSSLHELSARQQTIDSVGGNDIEAIKTDDESRTQGTPEKLEEHSASGQESAEPHSQNSGSPESEDSSRSATELRNPHDETNAPASTEQGDASLGAGTEENPANQGLPSPAMEKDLPADEKANKSSPLESDHVVIGNFKGRIPLQNTLPSDMAVATIYFPDSTDDKNIEAGSLPIVATIEKQVISISTSEWMNKKTVRALDPLIMISVADSAIVLEPRQLLLKNEQKFGPMLRRSKLVFRSLEKESDLSQVTFSETRNDSAPTLRLEELAANGWKSTCVVEDAYPRTPVYIRFSGLGPWSTKHVILSPNEAQRELHVDDVLTHDMFTVKAIVEVVRQEGNLSVTVKLHAYQQEDRRRFSEILQAVKDFESFFRFRDEYDLPESATWKFCSEQLSKDPEAASSELKVSPSKLKKLRKEFEELPDLSEYLEDINPVKIRQWFDKAVLRYQVSIPLTSYAESENGKYIKQLNDPREFVLASVTSKK